MTLSEYQILAKRTCPDLFADKDLGTSSFLNTAHMIYGMVSELSELISGYEKKDFVNIGEELGDMMWYVANYCTFNNLSLEDCLKVQLKDKMPVSTCFEKLIFYIGELADIEKKELAYKKTFSVEKQMDILQNIMIWVVQMYYVIGVNMYDFLYKNIEKLRIRYPDKFTEENALNRDLESERKVLEK